MPKPSSLGGPTITKQGYMGISRMQQGCELWASAEEEQGTECRALSKPLL